MFPCLQQKKKILKFLLFLTVKRHNYFIKDAFITRGRNLAQGSLHHSTIPFVLQQCRVNLNKQQDAALAALRRALLHASGVTAPEKLCNIPSHCCHYLQSRSLHVPILSPMNHQMMLSVLFVSFSVLLTASAFHRYIPHINNQIARTKLRCHNSLCTRWVSSLSETNERPAFLLKAVDLEFYPKDNTTQNTLCSTDHYILSNTECYYVFCNSKTK